jgi:hypothetical protein
MVAYLHAYVIGSSYPPMVGLIGLAALEQKKQSEKQL